MAHLFDEDLVLVVPREHPLAKETSLPLARLADMELLLPAPGTALRAEIDSAVVPARVVLRPAMELDGVRMIASLVFDGYGPAILPATVVPGHLRERFAVVPLEGLPRRRVGVAQRRRGLPSAPAGGHRRAGAGGQRPARHARGHPPHLAPARPARPTVRPTARRTRQVAGLRRAVGARHIVQMLGPAARERHLLGRPRTRGGRRRGRCAPSKTRGRPATLGVALVEDGTHQRRADAAPLGVGIGAQGGEIPVGLVRMLRLDQAEHLQRGLQVGGHVREDREQVGDAGHPGQQGLPGGPQMADPGGRRWCSTRRRAGSRPASGW